MAGMLYKDFLLTRKDLAAYALLLLAMGVVVGQGAVGATLLLGLMALYCSGVASALFTYDAKVHWPPYGACNPGGRARLVGGRYLYALVVLAGGVLAVGGMLLALSAMGRLSMELADALRALVACAAAALAINAFLLPALFLLGDWGRVLFVLVVVVLFVLLLVSLFAEERLGGVFRLLWRKPWQASESCWWMTPSSGGPPVGESPPFSERRAPGKSICASLLRRF